VLGSVTLVNGTVLPPGYAGGIFPPPGTFPLPGIFVGFTSAGNDIFGFAVAPSSASNDILRHRRRALQRARGVRVPEPATWGLMILGFGAAGSALRRRRPAIA
jgi:hypothetical protein